jgi:hypothetical protein
MPCICYQYKNFKDEKLELIDHINTVVEEYMEQGYTLTLRQLYYQLVARGIIENSQRSYKNTGVLINDARLAGLIDWSSLEDRTRNLKRLSHWESPEEIIKSASSQYKKDLWATQDYHLEVWVEKEALAEVVERACIPWDIPFFCCRGYVSQSEMWQASQRLIDYAKQGKYCKIIHLGDHDPSGIDMSRDIEERLTMFGTHDYGLFSDKFLGLSRIALNMDQIKLFNPPPNPAKITDTRCKSYMENYGDESWELDALEPKVIRKLIDDEVSIYANEEIMDSIKERVAQEKKVMERICEDWSSLYSLYNNKH